MFASKEANISQETTNSTRNLAINATTPKAVQKTPAALLIQKRNYTTSAQYPILTQDLHSAYRAVAASGATGASTAVLPAFSTDITP